MPPPTKEELLDFSRFDANAILRGAQLTFVGAQRALQNPNLWTTQHYRQAAIAVACGIAIRILIEIPIVLLKISLWFLSFVVRLDVATWDDALYDGLRFLQEYVLQVPLFLMTLMRHITPAMDELFMQSLHWVDYTYAQKHARDEAAVTLVDPRHRYYENLRAYEPVSRNHRPTNTASSSSAAIESKLGMLSPGKRGVARFLWRFGRKAAISLAIFALSYVPIVGRFVLPATSFYTFRRAVGLGPAALIFGSGLFLPRRYLVVFLQTYYGQRSLMRELLGPYFSRVHFSANQKRNWFRSREGILFGFGAGFYVLLRVPLVGVLIYGVAEASTAYLVTKITDPPPGQDAVAAPSSKAAGAMVASFADSQQTWHNKKAFLELALDNLDALQQQRRAGATGAAAYSADPDRPIGGGGGSSSSHISSGPFNPAQPPQPEQQPVVASGAQVWNIDPDRPSVQQRSHAGGNSDEADPPPPYSI
ncbi:hypothetical protein HMPREF1624_00969 [Sporothrix schenckii ATCC 58251]|uniref:Transmembrane protein UsgS n=1 Tax=Sporothrix schenckii (strain ATCC 58251 / de Perez 2211183) TaxID=1391915 RepID=U7Q487_SPOS1|nr:hypothetical protein HMPREF1624_00969 [Sporothrix schenckii ATCC 58251]